MRSTASAQQRLLLTAVNNDVDQGWTLQRLIARLAALGSDTRWQRESACLAWSGQLVAVFRCCGQSPGLSLT